MTAGEREICAYHEAGHAVSAVVSGMDLRAVVVHAHSDHGIGGYCELRDHDDERDTDAFRFVVYCYSASAAERRAGFTPSPFRAGGDIEQAETMAEAIFGEAAAKTMLASARVQADALMRDPTESGRPIPGAPKTEPVIVTTRFFRLPDVPTGKTTWVLRPPAGTPAPEPPAGIGGWFLLPYPTGADENSFGAAIARSRESLRRRRLQAWAAQAIASGAAAAEAQIRSRGETVYRLETKGAVYALSAR